MEKYEQPGVKINSKVPTKEYKDNYDRIFGKKESWLDRKERETSCSICDGNNLNKPCAFSTEKPNGCLKIKHDNCTN